jgi:hypothetical protein
MLGLLQQTLRPPLTLKASVESWREISIMLREASRRRELQMEKITSKWPPLS